MFNVRALYEEITTKFGFSDGNAIPPGAEECRDLLVEALNALAPADADIEAYGYDRPGMHNRYLLLWRFKGTTGDEEKLKTPDWAWDVLDLLEDNSYLYCMTAVEVEVASKADRRKMLAELKEGFWIEDGPQAA